MKHNREQIKEIFTDIWKKILSRNPRGNLSNHPPVTTSAQSPNRLELPANKQINRSFNKRKKLSNPRQLTLPLDVDKGEVEVKPYEDVDKWLKDNFDGDVYIGPDMSSATTYSYSPEFQYQTGKKPGYKYRDWLKEKPVVAMLHYNVIANRYNELKKSKHMSITEVTAMIQEIVEEELNEINHTTDSSGKTIIAQGAPGSVVRFATEHPDVIKQMRDWIKDCQWQDLPDEAAVDELSDEEVLRGIQNNYDGGIKEFLRGSNSQAQVPVGYKESLKENWSSGQQDDAPDGYSNDYQRAFAHSQATTPRENQTEKAKQLAKNGKFVVLVGHPVYCRATDAVLGISTVIEKVCNTREEAEKELEKFNTAEHSDDHVSIIGPDNLEPKQHKDEPSTDDVPFQEGVGYVYDKDMKKDPKHIPGERWRVKFEEGVSKSELRAVIKDLINEMWYGSKNDVEGDETHDEPMNEILGTYDKMIEFVKSLPPEEQEKLNKMSKEMGASAAVIKYLQDLSKQSPQDQSS